jgi:hypothetical protein
MFHYIKFYTLDASDANASIYHLVFFYLGAFSSPGKEWVIRQTLNISDTTYFGENYLSLKY